MTAIGNLLGSLVDVKSMVKKYIHKIVVALAKENSVDEKAVEVLIQSHEGNEFFYLYINKEFIRQVSDEEIEKYCKE